MWSPPVSNRRGLLENNDPVSRQAFVWRDLIAAGIVQCTGAGSVRTPPVRRGGGGVRVLIHASPKAK